MNVPPLRYTAPAENRTPIWTPAFVTSICAGLAALVAAITALVAASAVERQGEKIAETAKTVEIIHKLTDGQMGLTLKSLAEVAAAKVAITHTATDQKAADKALSNYLEHVKQETEAEDERLPK